MPVFQALSDLHLDFHRDHGQRLIASLDPTGVGALLLAGDIISGNARSRAQVARWLCDRYADVQVIWVPGNHEYYGNTPKDFVREMEELEASLPNLSFGLRKVIDVMGVPVVCTTLWFPLTTSTHLFLKDFNDSIAIKANHRWFFDQNRLDVEFLQDNVVPGSVVVTHHAPTPRSISPKYRNSVFNDFFVCDVGDLVRRPVFWVHGHMHDPTSYRLSESTWIICNPYGYPSESKKHFDPKLVFEVHS
jgi:Icc-related predicted phosphoesterase